MVNFAASIPASYSALAFHNAAAGSLDAMPAAS